ncbi:MAG: hypothetical protein AAF065_06110 [Verrucomicrobiota bacterium]
MSENLQYDLITHGITILISVCGTLIYIFYQSRREFKKTIGMLKAELADCADARLIEFFLNHKNSVRDVCSRHSIDVPFWKRKKFITTYTEFLNLQPEDIIIDRVRDKLKEQGSITDTAPHTPLAKFPGRERMNDLLTNLNRLAG